MNVAKQPHTQSQGLLVGVQRMILRIFIALHSRGLVSQNVLGKNCTIYRGTSRSYNEFLLPNTGIKTAHILPPLGNARASHRRTEIKSIFLHHSQFPRYVAAVHVESTLGEKEGGSGGRGRLRKVEAVYLLHQAPRKGTFGDKRPLFQALSGYANLPCGGR